MRPALDVKLIAAKGMRLVNPKRTRVAKCVRKVKRRKGVRNAYGLCQKSTGQSYRTGRALKKRKKNPSPYKYLVSTGGTHLARFLTLGHAKQYAQALANATGRQVRLTG
jgi:hypothetical protein